jgi:hypothetical protein
MKRKIKNICAFLSGIIIVSSSINNLTASATTVDDVIAHAYKVGLPESTIQQCINNYSSGTYTSEQCDSAIASLDSWAAKRDDAIADIEPQPSDTSAAETQPSSSTGNTSSSQTVQENTGSSIEEFKNMTLEEKKNYISNAPAEQKSELISAMTNDEKNQLLKQTDISTQADIVAEMLGVGEAFGINFSVDEISDDKIMISARDENGNLIDVTTFGNSVEATGIPYTVPVIAGSSAVLFSLAGIIWVLRKCR